MKIVIYKSSDDSSILLTFMSGALSVEVETSSPEFKRRKVSPFSMEGACLVLTAIIPDIEQELEEYRKSLDIDAFETVIPVYRDDLLEAIATGQLIKIFDIDLPASKLDSLITEIYEAALPYQIPDAVYIVPVSKTIH